MDGACKREGGKRARFKFGRAKSFRAHLGIQIRRQPRQCNARSRRGFLYPWEPPHKQSVNHSCDPSFRVLTCWLFSRIAVGSQIPHGGCKLRVKARVEDSPARGRDTSPHLSLVESFGSQGHETETHPDIPPRLLSHPTTNTPWRTNY